jgi:hypothetical protein
MSELWLRHKNEADAQERAQICAYRIWREALFNTLQAANLTKITVVFDGSGDSGQIEEINAHRGDAQIELPAMEVLMQKDRIDSELFSKLQAALEKAKVEVASLIPGKAELRDILETLCYHYLHLTHGGWENNDGAYGEFEFDVAERTVHLDFNERYVDTNSYEHDF